MKHCWHDSSVNYPPGPTHTVDEPSGQGRVCCYCGEVRAEPLPSLPPRRSHGPFVEDTSQWFVVDEVQDCPGMDLVRLNPESAVVDMEGGSGEPNDGY